MFRLLKYYLDLVTDDGTAFIGYAARLRLGPLEVGYSSALLSPSDSAPRERSAFDRSPFPARRGDAIAWSCPSLGLHGEWRALGVGLQRTLLQGRHGMIHWSCLMPRASAVVQLGDERLTGTGYIESLRLTIAPWQLPFRVLRWGRYTSANHSMVWIDWSGRDNSRWIWVDGRDERGEVTLDGVSVLGSTRELQFCDRREVRNRGVLDSLGETIGRLLPQSAGKVAGMREHKQLSRARLLQQGNEIDRGWALHEEVTW